VGKIERTFNERTVEQGWGGKNSAIRTPIDNCEGVAHNMPIDTPTVLKIETCAFRLCNAMFLLSTEVITDKSDNF